MGGRESKVDNTGEVVNEITVSQPNYSSRLELLVMLITVILVAELIWKIHSAYRGSLKRRYRSSARIAEI